MIEVFSRKSQDDRMFFWKGEMIEDFWERSRWKRILREDQDDWTRFEKNQDKRTDFEGKLLRLMDFEQRPGWKKVFWERVNTIERVLKKDQDNRMFLGNDRTINQLLEKRTRWKSDFIEMSERMMNLKEKSRMIDGSSENIKTNEF